MKQILINNLIEHHYATTEKKKQNEIQKLKKKKRTWLIEKLKIKNQIHQHHQSQHRSPHHNQQHQIPYLQSTCHPRHHQAIQLPIPFQICSSLVSEPEVGTHIQAVADIHNLIDVVDIRNQPPEVGTRIPVGVGIHHTPAEVDIHILLILPQAAAGEDVVSHKASNWIPPRSEDKPSQALVPSWVL